MATIPELQAAAARVRESVSRVIVGKDEALDLQMVALPARATCR